jgi:uncharacterized delta-60 repeat protein
MLYTAVIESLESRRLLAANPALDLTYGDLGTSRLQMGQFEGAIALTDGKTLAFGESGGSASSGSVGEAFFGRIAQLNSDGSLDTSFGGTGTMRFNKFGIRAAAVAADGTIFLAGSNVTADRIALARITPDGALDRTFGHDGIRVGAALGDAADLAPRAISILPDGRILVAASINQTGGSGPQIALLRFSADGQTDTSFGINGVRRLLDGYILSRAAALPDGQMVLGGKRAAVNQPFMVRLLSDGTIDQSFISRGLNSIGSAVGVAAIAVQSESQIFAAIDGSIVRLNDVGRLDTSFSADGIAQLPAGSDIVAIAAANDGTIIARATGTGAGFYRLAADGTPDESFGTNGFVTDPHPSPTGRAAILPAADSIVAVGSGNQDEWVFERLDDSADVRLIGSTLYVRGTLQADTLSLETSGASARLTRNGTSTDFPLADISKFAVAGGGGNDAVTLSIDIAGRIDGGDGNDTIATAGGADSINSGFGDDSVTSGAGDDTLSGDAASTGAIISAGDGDDILRDIGGASIDAGNGNDILRDAGAAVMHGGTGDDQIQTGSFTGSIFGDDGNDEIAVFAESLPTDLGSSFTAGMIDGGAGDDAINLSIEFAGFANLVTTVSSMIGGDGNDRLSGAGGNLVLIGGNGDDLLRAQAGNVPTESGSGISVAEFGKETLLGGDGNDTLDGGDGGDFMQGNAGRDLIRTGGSTNYVAGGGGSDRIIGQGASDTLAGGDGTDTISSLGTARISGGSGDDTFFTRNSISDMLDGGAGDDSATRDAADNLNAVEHDLP